jgi:DNA-binding transcriptional LysR family regulator
LELTHLKYFLALAEELHFGRAALRLHITQPPLSQQIKNLEQELDISLFTRTSRRVELTPAGRILLDEARDIIGRTESCLAAMRHHAAGWQGSLVLGFNEPAINTFLSHAVREFIRTYPDIKLTLLELETAEQLEALAARRIQLGIMRPYACDLSGLQQRLLLREPYLLALPAGHPLGGLPEIALPMLKDQPMIMFPRSVNPALFIRLRDCFHNAGFVPTVVQEAVSKHTMLALVGAGLGIALVPTSCQQLSLPDVIYRPVRGDLPAVEIHAVWHQDSNPGLIDSFLDIVARLCPDPGQQS